MRQPTTVDSAVLAHVLIPSRLTDSYTTEHNTYMNTIHLPSNSYEPGSCQRELIQTT